MDLQNSDIIYFVKDTTVNEELRYSLRSVEENFPHRKVWFIGGCPEGLRPDGRLRVDQKAGSKWGNTSLLLQAVCKCQDISDDYILFNDDFFVMQPVESLPWYSDGSLERRIEKLKTDYPYGSAYLTHLIETQTMLKAHCMPTINYAVHYPMPMNKQEMLKTFTEFSFGLMWRSLYGNHHRKLPTYVNDCKVYDFAKSPEDVGADSALYLSTTDTAFNFGRIGTYIKDKFPFRSRFEV